MSRLQFRASVDDPRPLAAWAMVSMAISTLAITGRILPWALAASAAAVLYSFAHRLAPRPWQRRAGFLNSAIVCIALLCIVLSLRGAPATIALAHFAVLTQGLQLLDARSRKSEFLLVALALFEVVLAANLTDSVLFPPMLMLFLASTTWTLLVHTLRSEAIEAGDAARVGRDLTRGLGRTTLLASVLSILLAVAIFTLLPRFRASMLERANGERGAVAGFTDEVRLGTIGKIRKDPSVVLRVETLEGREPDAGEGYWRGIAFDHFDGERWSVTPTMRSEPGGSPAFGIDLSRARAVEPLVQRIVREPVTGGVLFGNGSARSVRGAIRRVEVDVNGSLYSPPDDSQRVRYTIRTETRHPSDDELRRDRALPPRRRPDAYRSLPPLAPDIAALARRITAGLATDADRVRAIETHLRNEGHYTDSPRPMEGSSPIEGFLLGELSGHCEYFASGMVVLARSIGIPARLVNGFAGGQRNELGDFVELTRADAHAWVEVHYEEAGWVRYDPTPPDLRRREDPPPGLVTRVGELASAIELWWYQRVVDFDTSDQVELIRSTWLAFRAVRDRVRSGGTGATSRDASDSLEVDLHVEMVLAIGLLCALVWALARVRQPRRTRHRLPRTYARALALLRRRGLSRGRATTARDFAREVEARVPPANARAFHAITDAYLAERFGQTPPDAQVEHWKALRRGLPRRLAGAPAHSAP